MGAASAETETLSAQVETPDYRLTANGVDVLDYASNDLPGAPRLPLRGLTFDLPASGDWELTFESVGSRLLDERIAIGAVPVPDLNLNSPTSLTDLETLPSYVPTVDRPDPGIYGANAFYPASPVVAGEAIRQGDGRILPVRVFPFQYNPVTRQLLVPSRSANHCANARRPACSRASHGAGKRAAEARRAGHQRGSRPCACTRVSAASIG